MQGAEQTLDLEEEAESIRTEALPRLESRIEDCLDRAEAVDPPQDDEEKETLDRLTREYDELEAQRVTVEGYAEILERAAEEWGGSEVVLKELSGQEARMIKDEVRRKAERAGVDSYPDGAHEIEALKAMVVSTPPGAPDPSKIHGVPDRLFTWLYNRGNALNTVGDLDMGNSSLRERLAGRTR